MKSGIEYFPLDCQLDDKFELIEAEFGLTGFAVVVKLLQKIYAGQGYYCEWTNEVALLFSKKIGLGCNAVSEIVEASIKRGIFDGKLYEKYKILTSKGIQERYLEAVSRRKKVEVKKAYLLIKCVTNYKNVDILSENVYINQKNAYISKQSKVEESKVEESKVKESRVERVKEPSGSAHSHKPVKHKYGEYNNVLLTDEEVEKLKSQISDYQGYIERLSGYIESKGAKYKSHYATIRNWYNRDMKSGKVKDKSEHSYDLDEFESFTMNHIPKIGGKGQ